MVWPDTRIGRSPSSVEVSELEKPSVGRTLATFCRRFFRACMCFRNQLIHGGATWQGGVNRNQVRDGGRVLEQLVPVFVTI